MLSRWWKLSSYLAENGLVSFPCSVRFCGVRDACMMLHSLNMVRVDYAILVVSLDMYDNNKRKIEHSLFKVGPLNKK